MEQCVDEAGDLQPVPTLHPHGAHHKRQSIAPVCSECCYKDACNIKGCGSDFLGNIGRICISFHWVPLKGYRMFRLYKGQIGESGCLTMHSNWFYNITVNTFFYKPK